MSFRDRRYQRKIGFNITLELATTSIPVVKLLRTQLWKNSSMVKVVATIKESQYSSSLLLKSGAGRLSSNETIDHLIE